MSGLRVQSTQTIDTTFFDRVKVQCRATKIRLLHIYTTAAHKVILISLDVIQICF